MLCFHVSGIEVLCRECFFFLSLSLCPQLINLRKWDNWGKAMRTCHYIAKEHSRIGDLYSQVHTLQFTANNRAGVLAKQVLLAGVEGRRVGM